MGGTLGVESTPGEGSTFWVQLARTTAPRRSRREDTAGQPPAASGSADDQPVQTVLYVEDNLATVELMEEIFERRLRLKLLTAMRGEEALALAKEHRPALILLDMHLPDLNGDHVLAGLKSASETKDIPVVMLSADATERQVERLLAAGAHQYITKPVRVRDLLKTVDDIVG
jgi:CheY-like chemotaxis protein